MGSINKETTDSKIRKPQTAVEVTVGW